jgi:hypothetical protein
MSVDRYTKAVLTVIALCLVWISLGGSSLIPKAEAQAQAQEQRVFIAGWVDDHGTPRLFPRPLLPAANPLSAGMPITTR